MRVHNVIWAQQSKIVIVHGMRNQWEKHAVLQYNTCQCSGCILVNSGVPLKQLTYNSDFVRKSFQSNLESRDQKSLLNQRRMRKKKFVTDLDFKESLKAGA